MENRHITGVPLVLGATMRLSRLVVTDDVGGWFIREPARKWANRLDIGTVNDTEPTDPGNGWRSKLVSGLDCPFCGGFWVGAFVALTYALFGHTALWRFVAGVFTLNEVAAHAGARLGDVSQDA